MTIHDYYVQVLTLTLEPLLPGYIQFFSNPNRFSVLNRLLTRYFAHHDPKRVLNVGCGAFAAEMLLPALQQHNITSFDYMAEYDHVYRHLQNDGHLGNTTFFQADARNINLETADFDLIIMNDLFYEKQLNVDEILPKYANLLKPGGLLIFDIISTQTQWIWRLLGKPDVHQRYNEHEIQHILDKVGLECLTKSPMMGYKGGLDRLLRMFLWHLMRISNNYTFVAKKP